MPAFPTLRATARLVTPALAVLLAATTACDLTGPARRTRIVAPDSVLLGDTARLEFHGAISYLTWRTLDPGILDVVQPGVAVARGVGEGRVAIEVGGRDADTLTITVVARYGTEIALGDTYSCALTEKKHAACWGSGVSLPFGYAERLEWLPRLIEPLATYTQLSGGGSFACGIASEESRCWGWDDDGQLGDGRRGTGGARVTTVSMAGLPAALDAGGFHACALAASGAVSCWGDGRFGAAGALGDVDRTVPTAIAAGRTFTSVTAGQVHTCALDAEGTAWCWGQNQELQLGRATAWNSQTGWASDTLMRAAVSQNRYRVLDAGGEATCGIRTTGGVDCWGNAFAGDGPTFHLDSMPRSMLPDTRDVQAIASGGLHSCALDATGTAWCWGWNNHGQLGDGSTSYRADPVAVAGGALRFDAIGAGAFHTCGRATDGRLYCWGSNSLGQLGIDAEGARMVPTKVAYQP